MVARGPFALHFGVLKVVVELLFGQFGVVSFG